MRGCYECEDEANRCIISCMKMKSIDRRRFLQSIVAAAAAPMPATSCAVSPSRFSALRSDPDKILDLPAGFRYDVVSRVGTEMSDGLIVPGAHDGMAAFAGENGRIRIVCNHENWPARLEGSAFGNGYSSLSEDLKERLYDRGSDQTPGLGGTTTTIYDPATGTTESQFLSLGGTELNCSGGPTPWGSWLSCEESFEFPGTQQYFDQSKPVVRDKLHGFVVEVPADADELTIAQPLTAMGQFVHEAAAVHASSGIVYMTEDRHHSLFYRFIPNIPGKLHEGGTLQALAIVGQPTLVTNNWSNRRAIELNDALPVEWIDVLSAEELGGDYIRLFGAKYGAATFSRGEGLCVADDRFAFTCTYGGPAQLGQVFTYKPSPFEGTAEEGTSPGELMLIAEANEHSLLQSADNLTMAPWGDLIVCEDAGNHCGLVGIRPDGSQYAIADNAYSVSELAGVCFSPDGETLFVNIQWPGMTLAITGPWPG